LPSPFEPDSVTEQVSAGDAVRVRPVVQADLLPIIRIENASFPQPWPIEAFERYLDAPGFLVAVGDAPVADQIDSVPLVGYIVVDVIKDGGTPWGHVKDIAVHPERRGRGIGTTLLSEGIAAVAPEVDRLTLEVRATNEAAQRLYRRFGFRVEERDPAYYRDGEDALVMVRPAAGRER
jgi:ribosomal-protein-alanine N-acetyltransferase